jgi:hypothetical protein
MTAKKKGKRRHFTPSTRRRWWGCCAGAARRRGRSRAWAPVSALCRVLEVTRSQGPGVSRKRVARMMRELGLRSRRKRRFKATTDSGHKLPVADNILDRKSRSMRPASHARRNARAAVRPCPRSRSRAEWSSARSWRPIRLISSLTRKMVGPLDPQWPILTLCTIAARGNRRQSRIRGDSLRSWRRLE